MTESTYAAEGHTNATMRQTVVRGAVRHDHDWRPAIEDALSVIYTPDVTLQEAAAAVDEAMMRAIHAAHRSDAVRDLGVVALDSTNLLRRAWWRAFGARRAAARADHFNRESAAIAAEED